MLLRRDVSHVEEFLYLINLVQKGFYIKVSTKEGISIFILYSLGLQSLLFSLIMIRKRKSSSPVRIRIGHSPMASLVGHPSIVSLLFEIVFVMEGVVQFFLIGKIFVLKFL